MHGENETLRVQCMGVLCGLLHAWESYVVCCMLGQIIRGGEVVRLVPNPRLPQQASTPTSPLFQ